MQLCDLGVFSLLLHPNNSIQLLRLIFFFGGAVAGVAIGGDVVVGTVSVALSALLLVVLFVFLIVVSTRITGIESR